MKYANEIGVFGCIALIASCFLPWIYIPSINTVVTGMKSGSTNFGSPGMLHIFFSVIAVVFFLIPKIWAKRANVVFCTLNFAWALKNYLLISRCEAGECPEKQAGIFIIVALSLLMMVMSLIPKISLPASNE